MSAKTSIVSSREGSLVSSREDSIVLKKGGSSTTSSKDWSVTSNKRGSSTSSKMKEGSLGSSRGSSTSSIRNFDRLALPKREMTLAGETNFLPCGDCLPSWYNMSLIQKLPMFPAPHGALDLCANKLTQPKYVNKTRVEFDLTDPHNYCINNYYDPLSDPHLAFYLRLPHILKRIKANKEITPDNRVRCSLEEFNKYRAWLKHISLLEFKKQQEEERKKELEMKKLDPGDYLEVAIIETRIHREEVRQRQVKEDVDDHTKRRDQVLQLERQLAMHKKLWEEQQSQNMEATRQRNAHRNSVYSKAANLHRRRHEQKLNAYKEKMKRHLEYLKEVEASRVDDSAQKILEGWTRRKDYQMQYEDNLKKSFEKEEDRSLRYRRLLDAEMNRRWQQQAGKLQERKNKVRDQQHDLEETYSRNIAMAFFTSPRINPEGFKDVPATEAPPSVATDEGSTAADTFTTQTESVEGESSQVVSVPSLKTVFLEKGSSKEDVLAIEKPLEDLGVNVRLHDVSDKKSLEEIQKVTDAIKEVRKQVSGESLRADPEKTTTDCDSDAKPKKVSLSLSHSLETDIEPETDEVTEEIEAEDRGEWAKQTYTCQELTADERANMEALLQRLLKDLNSGELDKEDLVQLASICAALTASQLKEEATSTTSLDFVRESRSTFSGSKMESESSLSSSVSRVMDETLERVCAEKDEAEDSFGSSFVEYTIRNTVDQMARDLQDGTLSRGDVREIGSAIASVILGEVRSDHSVMAEDVVVPTLQHLLRDANDIDEVLLDQTMASLLSTYNQVTRRLDKLVWQVIKDFVVEVLLRLKSAATRGAVDVPQFLEAMESCRQTALHREMDLPTEDEFVMVLTTGISKISGVQRLSPVLCDLMKVILDKGQTLLVQRHGADKLSLPRIDTAMLEQVGESACGLEVALEVAATVADGLYQDMQKDTGFEENVQQTLAPAFLFALLASWGEMTAEVSKESVALQTSSKEEAYTATTAENVILMSMDRMWNDSLQGQLPDSVITHLALHIAEFPAATQPCSPVEQDEEGRIKLPAFVMRKISKLGQGLQEGELSFDDAKKMLAVVLQIYIREVLLSEDTGLPSLALEGVEDVRCNVTFLVTNSARKVMECVQSQVTHKLSQEDVTRNTAVGMTLVSHILHLMSSTALADVSVAAREGLSPSDSGDAQLDDIIKATTQGDGGSAEQTMSIPEFLTRIVSSIQNRQDSPSPSPSDMDELRMVEDLIRKQLGKVARDVTHLFAGLAALHQCRAVTQCPVLTKMLSFITAILMELRNALSNDVLSPKLAYDFLSSVAPESCPSEMKDDAKELGHVITILVQDIEWKKNRSTYFSRLVDRLAKLSLDSQHHEELAEGMAATANMLSTVDPTILNQFIQTTLVSLINSIRRTRRSSSTLSSLECLRQVTDESDGRRPTPPNSAGPKASENQAEKEAKLQNLMVLPDDSAEDSGAEQKGRKLSRQQTLPRDSSSDPIINEKHVEICNEAEIIAHIAIQTTMERLGIVAKQQTSCADRDFTESGRDVVDMLVNDIKDGVTNNREAPCKKFTHMHPSTASYAQGLLEDVSRHMEENEETFSEEEDDEELVKVSSIATIIISNTFKAIETGLTSGKLQVLLTTASTESVPVAANLATSPESGLSSQEASISGLSNCVTSTLDAVRCELDDLDRTPSDKPTPSSRPWSDHPRTMQRAKQIVDFLIQRVRCDTGTAKVEFQMDGDQRLAVVSPTDKKQDSYDTWELCSNVTADTVLQTFQEVLSDMLTQNQFFNPDSPNKTKSISESMILPCLPYLLDEFILANLHDMAVQLTKHAAGGQSQIAPTETMTVETMTVASSFRNVIKEMMAKCKTVGHEDNEEESAISKMAVLTVLDRAIERVLEDADISDEDLNENEELPEADPIKLSPDDKKDDGGETSRTSSQVKSDMAKLRNSIGEVSEAARRYSDHPKLEEDRNLVLSATRQIIASLQEDRMSDDDLDSLVQTFLPDEQGLNTREQKRDKLEARLSSLVTSITAKIVPASRLMASAAEIAVLDSPDMEHPQVIARALRRVSNANVGFNPEYLKMAVVDLLSGYNSDDSTTPAGMSADNAMGKRVSGDVLLSSTTSSIGARTISKMCVMDDSDNRESSLRTVYSTQITLPTPNPVDDFSDNKVELSESSQVFETPSDSQHRDESPETLRQIDADGCRASSELENESDDTAQQVVLSGPAAAMKTPQITLMAAPSDRTLTDPTGVEAESEEETNVAGAAGEGDDREAHPGEEETRGNEGAAGEEEEAGSEEAIVKVQRTRSDTSKESGSKASVDAANEDWNRSAVRVTHQSYATRVDKIAECKSSTPEPPLMPPLLVQAGRMEESSSKKRPQDEGNQCNSAVYSKQASGVSEIITMVENAQTQSQSAMEKGSNTSQEPRRKFHKCNNKKASSGQVPKTKVQTNDEPQFAKRTKQLRNSAQSGCTDENAELLSSPTEQRGRQRPENTRSGEMIFKRNSSTDVHRQAPVTVQSRAQDGDEAAASSTNCPKPKTSTRTGRHGALEGDFKLAGMLIKRGMPLYPYLETQKAVTPQYSGLAVAPGLERARQKAFAFGRSMFDRKLKDKRLENRKMRDLNCFYRAVAEALERRQPVTPHPPKQPSAAERGKRETLTAEGGAGKASEPSPLSRVKPRPAEKSSKRPAGRNLKDDGAEEASSSSCPGFQMPPMMAPTAEAKEQQAVARVHASPIPVQVKPAPPPKEGRRSKSGIAGTSVERKTVSTSTRRVLRYPSSDTNSCEKTVDVLRTPSSTARNLPLLLSGEKGLAETNPAEGADKGVDASHQSGPEKPNTPHLPSAPLCIAVAEAKKTSASPAVSGVSPHRPARGQLRVPHPPGGNAPRLSDEARPSKCPAGPRRLVEGSVSQQNDGATARSSRPPARVVLGPKLSVVGKRGVKLVPRAPNSVKPNVSLAGRREVKMLRSDEMVTCPVVLGGLNPSPPSSREKCD